LGSGATYTAVSDAVIYGNSGFETIKVQDGVVVTLDGNIERVEFARPSSSYTYQATSTGIDVLLGGNRVASVVNSEKLAFTNGSAMVAVTFTPHGLGFTLGGSSVSTTAGVVAFLPNNSIGEASAFTASISLNANSTSAIATAAADFFNIASGNYSAAIAGFGINDKLVFVAGTLESITNSSVEDGIITIAAVLNNEVVTIQLTGVSPSLDAQVFDAPSFNAAFGTGSLV
jgi:hypothetical protein